MKEFNFDGEVARQIPDAVNYAITKQGNVYRISTGRVMAQFPTGSPGNLYLNFRACHNNVARAYRIHVAMAKCWLDIPDNPMQTVVNHIDGNTYNNSLGNLEWCTHSQNQRHAVDTGLKQSAEDCYNASMTNDQVHLACQDLQSGMRAKDVADKYDVPVDNIRKLKAGDTYFTIRVLYNIPHTYKTNLSESTVRWVCERINEGYADKKIAEMSHNGSVKTIECKRIRYKIRYRTISDEYF